MTSHRENPAEAEEDPLVLVGEITAPFGIQGQVKMRPLMDNPNALTKLPSVTLRYPDGHEVSARVRGTRLHSGTLLATIADCADRNAAERLRDVLVLIRRSQLPPLEEGAYYESQLLGLRVVTESGRDFGPITHVHFYPANDVYETEVALIPAVEAAIVRVDLASGEMLVRDIAGLRKDE